MDKLSKRLNDEQLRALLPTQLTPGRILCLNYDFPQITKDKFMVMTCFGERCVFLMANSRILPCFTPGV